MRRLRRFQLTVLREDNIDRDKKDFSYHLVLGETDNSYEVRFDVDLTDEWTPENGCLMPDGRFYIMANRCLKEVMLIAQEALGKEI